jgi:predicted CXXCH cytochrome family protein
MSCHPQVSSLDLGSHSALNNSSAVENGDCTTCHYKFFPMVKGAVNNSNTYFCADCHTNAGTGPNKSSKIFIEKRHGEAACMDCHAADGKYHQDNPRGSVANLTYVNRFATANINTTDCADCHRAANLDDAPFNAPGMGTHSTGVCANGGCHGGGSTSIQVVHSTNPLDVNKPTITAPTLSSSTVTQGTDVNVTVTVNFPTNYATIDGAQYRIMLDSTEIKSWTPMSAADGNFNTQNEVARGRINTNNLSGTYSIEVRGMAGGPAQDPTIRYYPINGDVSAPKNVTLTVNEINGYINGTIYNGTGSNSPLEGALVSTNGANYTTGSDGKYSFGVPPGPYIVTASKAPTHNDGTMSVTVTASNTSYANMTLSLKLTGNIIGSVTNV